MWSDEEEEYLTEQLAARSREGKLFSLGVIHSSLSFLESRKGIIEPGDLEEYLEIDRSKKRQSKGLLWFVIFDVLRQF